MLVLPISDAADALIVNEETGGRALYEKTEMRPTWPAFSSGVTVGCGYDCGYATRREIADDWGDHLPADAIAHLQDCVGVTGSPARALAHEIAGQILVPWEMAIAVFRKRDIPKYAAMVVRDLEHCDEINGDCFGVLLSVAFNRGPHWSDPRDRFTEMRAIKALMHLRHFDLIPQAILGMRRLWPKGGDLWRRREHEAALFQHGLQQGGQKA